MKISFIEPHLKLFGGIRRIIEISNRLTERGHDVTIFHSYGDECQWMKCIAKTKPARDVLQQSHDVLIYNDPVALDYGLTKKADAKVKIYFVLGLYQKELLTKFSLKLLLPWNWRSYYIRRSLNQPYQFLCNASWEQNWLKEKMGMDSELLIGGINTEVFYPAQKERTGRGFKILYSGDIRGSKGGNTIKRAIEIVKVHHDDIIIDTYHGKGLSQDQMAEKYSQADLFVEASLHGGWNNPVAEAMACKVPVVCTDIGSVEDFAFNEETALLVPVKDEQAMAQAILRMIDDEELRGKLRENAYRKITQFTWDDCIDKLESVLGSMLERSEFNRSYTGKRDDVLVLVPEKSRKVLDVGCSVGLLGEAIKRRCPGAEVKGVEYHKKMADVAKQKLDKVIVADAESLQVMEHFEQKEFDCIIFADLLEHLRDPWDALRGFTEALDDEGVVILSLPNVQHFTTIFSLVFLGRWPYRNRGIHDKTHLRFFTLKNIREMLDHAGLKVDKVNYRYRFFEGVGLGPFNRISWLLGLPIIKNFFVFQYLITAKKK